MIINWKDLAINKGNSCDLFVQFTNEKDEVLIFEENSILYFTLKDNFYSIEYLFQKTSFNGITYNEEKEGYDIRLNCEDTEDLDYKDYAYDITVVRNTGLASANKKDKTTILKGYLKIEEVTTFEVNEVSQ